MKQNRQNLPICQLFAVFKFLSGSLYGDHFEEQFFEPGFWDVYLKVWMPDNKILEPELCDKSLDPGGVQVMRSNPDYSGLKGCYQEGSWIVAQDLELMATFWNS